jgi:hypothetical protein
MIIADVLRWMEAEHMEAEFAKEDADEEVQGSWRESPWNLRR